MLYMLTMEISSRKLLWHLFYKQPILLLLLALVQDVKIPKIILNVLKNSNL